MAWPNRRPVPAARSQPGEHADAEREERPGSPVAQLRTQPGHLEADVEECSEGNETEHDEHDGRGARRPGALSARHGWHTAAHATLTEAVPRRRRSTSSTRF